jgi:hypothetical protein
MLPGLLPLVRAAVELAEAAGLTAAKVDALTVLTLDPLPEDRDFPVRSGFESASIPASCAW